MLKIMTVLGTRPEIVRLSQTIKVLDLHANHVVVHTGQNFDYELNEIFFEDLDLRKPDIFLNCNGGTTNNVIGQIFINIDKVFEEHCPDAVLILGDTNSALTAICAKKRNIPVFHLEAGNRCFDQSVPEELNRKIVDHISDINIPYTSLAKQYLISEGYPADRIVVLGSPMREVLSVNQEKIERSEILADLGLQKDDYYLVSSHRHENIENDSRFQDFIDMLRWLSNRGKKILVSTHPRLRKRIESQCININGVEFMKPLGFTDYCHLQVNAKLVLSDSGTITEEASILDFAALNLRVSHERPEGMEHAAVMLVGYDIKKIESAIAYIDKVNFKPGAEVYDYRLGVFSERCFRVILSYLNYSDR